MTNFSHLQHLIDNTDLKAYIKLTDEEKDYVTSARIKKSMEEREARRAAFKATQSNS
jgi:bacterioferritin (cytochrome b1)